MLVLSRQTGERLIIDGNIEVTVVEIRPDQIKLGVTAPPEVAVHREEVFRRIAATTLSAQYSDDESRFLPEFA